MVDRNSRFRGRAPEAVIRGEENDAMSFRERFGANAGRDTGGPATVFNDDNTPQPERSALQPGTEYQFEPRSGRSRGSSRLRAARPVIGSGELAEQERRAQIDASQEQSRLRRAAGPRLSRGFTRGQQATLTSGQGAQGFLQQRLANRIAARSPDPATTDARDAQMRQDEMDQNLDIAQQGLAQQERQSLREMASNERIAGMDAAARVGVAEARAAGQLRRSRSDGSNRNTSLPTTVGEDGVTRIDAEAFGQLSPEQLSSLGDGMVESINAEISQSGLAETVRPENTAGLARSTLLQTQRDMQGNSAAAQRNRDMFANFGPAGLEDMMLATIAIPGLGSEDGAPASARSLFQTVDQLVEMTATEDNSLFFGGRTATVGGQEIDLDQMTGRVATGINNLREATKMAALRMRDRDESTARQALRKFVEADLEAARDAAGARNVQRLRDAAEPGRTRPGNFGIGPIDRNAPAPNFDNAVANDNNVQRLNLALQQLNDGDWDAFARTYRIGADNEDLTAEARAIAGQ